MAIFPVKWSYFGYGYDTRLKLRGAFSKLNLRKGLANRHFVGIHWPDDLSSALQSRRVLSCIIFDIPRASIS